MAEDTTASGPESDGQAADATATQSAATAAPGTTGGQATARQTSGAAPQSGHTGDVIYDPQEWERHVSALPDDLRKQADALRKSLQSDYTRKTKTIAERRRDLDLVDNFRRDPHGTIRQIAQQYGYNLAEAQQKVADAASSGEFNPQNWNEVKNWVMQDAVNQVLQQLKPVFGEVQNLKRSAIEGQLDQIDPTWRSYEDTMIENLQRHPTLAQDPATLYRLSVPQELLESRATQRALEKMERRTKAGAQAGSSTTTTKSKTAIPDKPVSFQEAVNAAKAVLAEQGLKP